MDWQAFIFNPDENWIGRMEKRARKRFCDENVADEALNYALKKLGENNWQRLNTFQGRSKPGTFLYSILNNQLEDFSRKKFGYPRPPIWIERLGTHWKTIWKRLCLEREEEQALLVIYKETEEHTREIIKTIKSKITNCGQTSSITSIGGTVADHDHENDYDLDAQLTKHSQSDCQSNADAESQTEKNQSCYLLAALCQAVDIQADDIDINAISKQIEQQSSQFKELFQLKPEQILLLKLKYQQGYKIPAIARILKLKEYKVRRNLSAAESQMVQFLKNSGFDISDFLEK